MADQETINNQSNEEHETRAQQRIKELSEKVELTAKERDEKDKLVKERDEKIAGLERENAFNTGFVDVLGQHPSAKEFKDAIKEKVMSGYSVEDAAYAVLGKAGKLSNEPTRTVEDVAGGSATTNVQSSQKEIKDMTTAEKRAILEKEILWS